MSCQIIADNSLEYFVDYFKKHISESTCRKIFQRIEKNMRKFHKSLQKNCLYLRETGDLKLSAKIFVSPKNVVNEYEKRLDEQLNGKALGKI